MRKLLLVLLALFICGSASIIYTYSSLPSSINTSIFLQGLDMVTKTDETVLGSALVKKNHYENVYNNTNADVYRFTSKKPGKKFAFILGEHPYEWEAHQAFYDAISKYASSPQFEGQIDIYWIHVPPAEAEMYDEGRLIGVKSVNSFVVPRIQKEKYDAVFDVHSGWQGWPYYERPKWFMLSASTDQSRALSDKISKNLDWDSTLGNVGNVASGYYVANPIASSGNPYVMLEWGYCIPEYLWFSQGRTDLNATDPGEYEDKLNHALVFLQNMDQL